MQIRRRSVSSGLIVVAKGTDGHGYVLADGSGKYSSAGWAERARLLKGQYRADCYVCEVNDGGDLVEATLRAVDAYGKVVKVHASHDKLTRAEPVSALYEQRKMHHVDPQGEMFKILEDQMTTFVAGVAAPWQDLNRRGWTSPDRMDALVWACHELFLKEAVPHFSMFTSVVNVLAGLPPSYFRKPWEW